MNLLNIALMPVNFTGHLSFLGVAVKWIIYLGVLMGSVGLGIIIFTLLIKLLTMPFEIYSRISMKKSSLAMEKLKPQLEKMKAQYKNDEQTFRLKSMELYKKNGFSPFKACLPLLITLPLFFIIFSGFNNYSAWANKNNYEQMARAYNQSIEELATGGENFQFSESSLGENTYQFTRITTKGDDNALVQIITTVTINAKSENANIKAEEFFKNYNDGNGLTDAEAEKLSNDTSPIRYNKICVVKKDKLEGVKANPIIQAAIEKLPAEEKVNEESVVKQVGRNAAEKKYREESKYNRFLWVKNIWMPDLSYRHPIQNDVGLTEERFNELTYNLEKEKNEANGYFIIIFLSAGALFVSQFFISNQSKMQNEVMQGNGKMNKFLRWLPLILIPAMYIYFGFTYSMAYMMYLFLSSLISFVSNLILNVIVEKKYMQKEAKEIQAQYNRRIPKNIKK